MEELKEDVKETYDYKKTNKVLFITFILFFVSSIMFLICDLIPHYDFSTMKLESLITSIKFASYFITLGLIVLFVVQLFSKGYKNLDINKKISNILEFVVILPVVLVIYTYIFTFGLTFATVDGMSMYDTLNDGDEIVLFYDKDLERNEIVVLNVNSTYYNYSSEKSFIKRIIGVPGDTIKFIKNADLKVDLYINGQYIESYTDGETTYSLINSDVNTDYTFFYYDSEHVRHETNVIPEGYYFVMGDNRAHSNDSRSIGLVRYEDIVGTVKYRTINGNMFKWEALK